jgi:DNA-binding response OmpR family regulator
MKKILIVEDQQDVQNLLEIALAKPDRKLLHAVDAITGLSLARDERPDLILLDLMMPGEMDGFGLLLALKEDPQTADAKIIIMSARTQVQDQETALNAGADSYITKPFKLTYLRGCIDRALL